MKNLNVRILVFYFLLFNIVLLSSLLFSRWYFHLPEDFEYITLAPSKFIHLGDTEVHYVEELDDKTQPTLLFVHGYASSTYTWHKLWPLLAPHYHVVALDLPGFGLSEKKLDIPYTLEAQAERLKTFIEKTQNKPVYVVSWSMGSLLSFWIAKDHPELFEKIVALTPAVDPDVVFGPYILAEWAAPYMANWFITPQFIKLTFFRVFAKMPEDKDHFAKQAYYPYHKNPDAYHTLIKHIRILADSRIPNEIKNIATPIRILAGEKDRIVKLKNYKKFLDVYPNADIHYHAQAGHGIMLDEPEWVFEKTMEFFKD